MHLLGTFCALPIHVFELHETFRTYSLPFVIFEPSAVSSQLVLGILAFTTAENAEGGKIKYMECLYIVNSMEIERM